MSKHTPGPWKIVSDKYGNIEIIADVRDYIYTVVPANEYFTTENARLIAAAPEMFDFIKNLAYLDYSPGMSHDDSLSVQWMSATFYKIRNRAEAMIDKVAEETK